VRDRDPPPLRIFPKAGTALVNRRPSASLQENWKSEVKGAIKAGRTPSLPPPPIPEEPIAPRLVLSDITIERIATLLSRAAPKG
jgi:hypothetical protein